MKEDVTVAVDVRRISGEACKQLRPLWEEVFSEDSQKFTDYYFENKAYNNIGYTIGEFPYDAMMFRTPYKVQIGEAYRELSYLVGVATRKEKRKKGYMRALLTHTMKKMYEEGMPFTYLMPANPLIYEPFGFSYVYERDVWKPKEEASNLCRTSTQEIYGHWNGQYAASEFMERYPQFPLLEKIAEFANKILKTRYQIYVRRDKAYYQMQLKESKAQNGDIYVYFEDGIIKAVYLYAKEEENVFYQEVLEEEEGILSFLKKEEKKKPIIMARIIDVEEMMRLVTSKEPKEVILQVEDPILKENNGVFRWSISPKESTVIRLEGANKADYKMSVSQLAPWMIKEVFLNEIV